MGLTMMRLHAEKPAEARNAERGKGLRWAGILGMFLFFLAARPARPQSPAPSDAKKNPPAAMPYANMPSQAVPFRRFRKPYQEWYVTPDTLEYDGGAREEPDPDLNQLKTINIGFLGPLDATNQLSNYGIPMLQGSQLAIEEANAQGGYRGKPFKLFIHNDLPLWGASAMEIVKMRYDEGDWGMLGSVDSASTHIALRASLKVEVPMVDTATNDPTVTETRVQWLLHNYPDDRQQSYALAGYIFGQLKLKNVGVIRDVTRYGRMGDKIFIDEARRIGHEPMLEVKYDVGETDFTKQLLLLRNIGIDGLVIWGNAQDAGRIIKQMRALGMKQPVFGSSHVAYPDVINIAGPAADGLVVISAMDPTRDDPKWQAFRSSYQQRFHEEPDPFASYAYDGMNILIGAIRKAGLNRGRIMDALRDYEMTDYQGVSGTAFFDFTLNNIAPVMFAQVKDGRFDYWPEQRSDWKDGKPLALLHH